MATTTSSLMIRCGMFCSIPISMLLSLFLISVAAGLCIEMSGMEPFACVERQSVCVCVGGNSI
ncbi:hypothetical protein M433DRAFT_505969 [Acidomyces richmondensis BFW]|nr:MAG: hypothetical protein FE78DRAFT_311409 [Acidomyces sp. 'richmondensis']KYG47290.1 hypothetical protein M433DRAFT_505969 [Acidomyces richmondensis BFW]